MQYGGARDVARWLIAVLSNGERSIGSAMDEAGKTAKVGQSIRILNIPLFGEYGAFCEAFSPSSLLGAQFLIAN
jgi:uncharacterized protein (DUF927 family)